MITRRLFAGASIAFALLILGPVRLSAQTPSSFDPPGIVNSIYERVTKGSGDGVFLIEGKAAKAKYLSKSLIALWAKADDHTRKAMKVPLISIRLQIRRHRA